jgi:hypothetical protein
MKIIAHRGKYSKKSPDNNISGILKASHYSPQYIEIDVQQNYLGNLVLAHDSIAKLSKTKQRELPKFTTLIEQTLSARLLIEIKQPGIADFLIAALKNQPAVSLTTFSLQDARIIKQKTKYEIFIMQRIHPIGLIKKCIRNNLDGLGINKNWLLLAPFIYHTCQKNNKKMFIYTVNSILLAKLIVIFMPNIYICTDKTNQLLRK